MSNCCKHICDRFQDMKNLRQVKKNLKNKHASYETGLRAFCSVCNKPMRREVIINFRCPCCNSVVRTHSRSRTTEILMTVD